MIRNFIKILSLGVLLAGGVANAQTFAPSANAPAKVQAPEPAVEQPSISAGYGANYSSESDSKEAAVAEKGQFVKSVEKNFGEEKKDEKKYSNTYGKVYQIRIENGKVVYDDERKILVYYDDYKVERGMDNIVRCSMRIYVLNDLTERISNLGLKLKWPEISTNVQMSRVNPGVKTYMDIMLLGEGCFSMDKTPTIEVNRCRVKGMSEDKCADAIRWFKKNQ